MYKMKNAFPPDVIENIDKVSPTLNRYIPASQLCWGNMLNPYTALDLYSKIYMYQFIDITDGIDGDDVIDMLRSLIDLLIPEFTKSTAPNRVSMFALSKRSDLLKYTNSHHEFVDKNKLTALDAISTRLMIITEYIYEKEDEI